MTKIFVIICCIFSIFNLVFDAINALCIKYMKKDNNSKEERILRFLYAMIPLISGMLFFGLALYSILNA